MRRILTRALVLGATVASMGAFAASANATQPQGWWVFCTTGAIFPVFVAQGQDFQFTITLCVNHGGQPLVKPAF